MIGGGVVEQIEREASMLSSQQIRQLQRDQHTHDHRNHFEIWSLHKTERLKHYGLHFAKYVGRFARGSAEPKHVIRTITDTFLINLSAANTLNQDFSAEVFVTEQFGLKDDSFCELADAAGRFADACEKVDHLEEFGQIARTANYDITAWVLRTADERSLDLMNLVAGRRKEITDKLFYLSD